jgi:hypothetical protein
VTRDEFGRAVLAACGREVWFVAAVALLCVVVSYLSLCFLRGLPDFPDKAAMLRGARWGGLVVAAWLLVNTVLICLGLRFSDYPLSGMILSNALCIGTFHLLVVRRGDEFIGTLACLNRLRLRPFDFGRWLEDRAQSKARACLGRRQRWIAHIGLALGLAGYLCLAASAYFEFDRWFAGAARDERFGARIRDAVALPEVRDVVSFGPAQYRGPIYILSVHVRPQTTPDQATAFVERVRAALSARKDMNLWRILIGAERGHTLAKGYYVPEGMTLPPDADHMRLPPRW